jgi:hypothetical protein
MGADNVQQLSALSGLFKRSLDVCLPDSVAILKQGFRLLNEELRPLPTGKTLWLGIFSSAAIGFWVTSQEWPISDL